MVAQLGRLINPSPAILVKFQLIHLLLFRLLQINANPDNLEGGGITVSFFPFWLSYNVTTFTINWRKVTDLYFIYIQSENLKEMLVVKNMEWKPIGIKII